MKLLRGVVAPDSFYHTRVTGVVVAVMPMSEMQTEINLYRRPVGEELLTIE